MSLDKAKKLIEDSFLKPLLKDDAVTDISFNGQDIYFQHNLLGRRKFKNKVSQDEAMDFIRQLSNLSEKFFSTSEPILDISVDKYRINAVHPSIARVGNDKALTFSIRISSKTLRKLDDNKFMPTELAQILNLIVKNNQSLIIAGLTGTGKTELQKYLLSHMQDNTRVIIIDNVLELDQVRNNSALDINSWQFDERNTKIGINQLIKNALRSNPDWLIVAEARGGEMIEVLNSALTGHPIITTLHSESVYSIIPRMISMVRMNEKKMDDEDIRKDISSHIHYYVYIKKKINAKNEIERYISNLLYVNFKGETFAMYDHDKSPNKIYINDDIKQNLNLI